MEPSALHPASNPGSDITRASTRRGSDLFYEASEQPASINGLRQPHDQRGSKDSGKEHTYNIKARVPPLVIVPTALWRRGLQIFPRKMDTTWVTLLYDLILTAVLSNSAADHELSEPAELPIFFSYFVIMWWIWMSQVAYDVRFGTDDVVNRLLRLLQLCSFLYFGAVGFSWDLGHLVKDEDVYLESLGDAASNDSTIASFKLVAFTYAASRGLLAAQYALTCFIANRGGHLPSSIMLPCVGLALSLILAGIAGVLPSTSESDTIAKAVLLYLSIAVEVIVEVIVSTVLDKLSYTPSLGEALAERLAALTLIILGEGFVGVLRTVDRTINAFTRSSASVFIDAASIAVIGFMVWLYYFECFEKEDFSSISKGRRLLWVVVHFPLHFCVLALMAGVANSLRHDAFWTGSNQAINDLGQLYSSLEPGQIESLWNETGATRTPVPVSAKNAALRIGSLAEELGTPPESMVYHLWNASNHNETDRSSILSMWYGAQMMRALIYVYDVEWPDEAERAYDNLTELVNPEFGDNTTVTTSNVDDAVDIYAKLFAAAGTTSLKATLWILPTAGATFFLLGVLNFVRSQRNDLSLVWIDVAQIGFGIVMSLLSLLDIGPKAVQVHTQFDRNLNITEYDARLLVIEYRLVDTNWILPMIAILCGSFWLVTAAVVFYVRWGDPVLMQLVSPIEKQQPDSVQLDAHRAAEA